jgi:hypothetical protein
VEDNKPDFEKAFDRALETAMQLIGLASERYKKELEERDKEIERLLDFVGESFSQSCYVKIGEKYMFDHCHISTYEEMQELLLEKGRIKKEDCYRD